MKKKLYQLVFFIVLSFSFLVFAATSSYAECPAGLTCTTNSLPSGGYLASCDTYCGNGTSCSITGPFGQNLVVGTRYAMRRDAVCNNGPLSCLGRTCEWTSNAVDISCSTGNVYRLYKDSTTFVAPNGSYPTQCSSTTASACHGNDSGEWVKCSELGSWTDESIICGDPCGGATACPASCNMCSGLNGCSVAPSPTSQYTPTPTETPIPTVTPTPPPWECPGGYNQQCVSSGGSCSEMRIANCGICGGSNDCCCTSVVPGLCPNNTCDASESCSTCEVDCGRCPTPTLPPPPVGTMRTITGKLFIDSGGTTAQQDVGESCYDQPVTVRIEDTSNPAFVYTTTANVVAGCATYSQSVQDGRTYKVTISGLTNYQVTGWNNGCNPNTPGCSSTTVPAQITLN